MTEQLTARFKRYVPLLCWMFAIVVLVLIPFKILGYGFVPGGDARRHVAQAICQRPYTDVVVMRPEYTIDHSPGWDWILRKLHNQTGWQSDALIGFSVGGLMLAMFLAPIPWIKRPEAWIAALLAMTVAIPEVLVRWTQARPYIFTEAVLIAVLFAWSKSRAPSRWTLIWTSIGIALSVWIHGAWYLWALPVAAFALAGWWRPAVQLGACSAIGVIGGALLTGKPFEFLKQAWFIATAVSHQNVPKWLLVGEFQPSYGEGYTLLLVALVFYWRSRRRSFSELAGQPAFALIAIGWMLGLYADRFWADWGVPAVIVWLALQFEEAIAESWEPDSISRALLAGLVAMPLLLHSTNDLDRRYTRCLDEFHLDARNPELQGWFPETGGIFYSADMRFFYNTYYDNPAAPWRYVLGFEPALMLDDDLKTYFSIQRSGIAWRAFEPWVIKMRPSDRLAVYNGSKPDMPGLQWKYAGGTLWIGKK